MSALPVPAGVTKRCDTTSVGGLITDPKGRVLTLGRVRPPYGHAPVAGHIDDHGGPVAALTAEIREESGLTLHPGTLPAPVLTGLWVPGPCRRLHPLTTDGPGHVWHVWHLRLGEHVSGRIGPEAGESTDLHWRTGADLAAMTALTAAWARHDADHDALRTSGIEPVWALLLDRLGVVSLAPTDRDLIAAAVAHGPYSGRYAEED